MRAAKISALVRLLPSLLVIIPALAGAPPVAAQAKRAAPAAGAPSGPKALGKFEDWTAAIHEESGQTVCYAFTYATNSAPSVAGRTRPVLTVTERPTGRDAVALSAGFAFAGGAEVTVQVEQTALNFYTAGRSAFAREGTAAVAAFNKGRQAVARSPGPRGVQVVDTFNLRGFSAAYQAIVKACPR